MALSCRKRALPRKTLRNGTDWDSAPPDTGPGRRTSEDEWDPLAPKETNVSLLKGRAHTPATLACRAAAEGDWSAYLRHAGGVLNAKCENETEDETGTTAGYAWLVLRAFAERARFDDASQRFEQVHAGLERCIEDQRFLHSIKNILIEATDRNLVEVAAQSVARLAFAENGRARMGAAGFIEILWEARSRHLRECHWPVVARLSEALAILLQYDANAIRFWTLAIDWIVIVDAFRAEVQDSPDEDGPTFALEAIVALIAFQEERLPASLVMQLTELVLQVTVDQLAAMNQSEKDPNAFLGRIVAASALADRLVCQCLQKDAVETLYRRWLPMIRQATVEAKWEPATTWRLLSNAANVEAIYDRMNEVSEKGAPDRRSRKESGNVERIATRELACIESPKKLEEISAKRRGGQRASRGSGRVRRSSVEVAS